MSHDRSVRGLVNEIHRLTGIELEIRRVLRHGLYLYEHETGANVSLGDLAEDDSLSPADQERLCRVLHHVEWIVLLGLDPQEDED